MCRGGGESKLVARDMQSHQKVAQLLVERLFMEDEIRFRFLVDHGTISNAYDQTWHCFRFECEECVDVSISNQRS